MARMTRNERERAIGIMDAVMSKRQPSFSVTACIFKLRFSLFIPLYKTDFFNVLCDFLMSLLIYERILYQ